MHSTLAHERLLVAEDEPIIALELQQVLENQGATVFSASSVPQALRLTETSALSAAVIDVRLRNENAGPVCNALNQRQVPFIFYTGSPDRPSSRWSAAPLVSKPAPVPVIIGALKYALSADKHDVLLPLTEHGRDLNLIAIDQCIVDGEERIARITRVIASWKEGGFDTSAAESLHATMIVSLNVMRDHRRLLASPTWP